MVPRRLRLSRPDFTAVVESRAAKRATTTHFSAVFFRIAHQGGCAVVISKKVAKTSVGRHLLKRRILSVLQPFCKPNAGLIVYARSNAATLTYTEIYLELMELLEKGPFLPNKTL